MNKLNVKNLIFVGTMILAFAFISVPMKSSANYPGFYMLSGKYTTNTNSNTSSNTNTGTNNQKENPAPIINKVNPNNIALNSGTQEIIITGSGFIRNSVAKLNGEDRPTTYVNANRLLMEISQEDTARNGKNIVTVYNMEPGGGYSNGVFLTIGNGQVAGASTKATTQKASTKSSKNTKAITQPATAVIGSNLYQDGVSVYDENENNSLLSANVSRSGFIPNTIFGWLLLGILILLAILLWRRIWVKDQDKRIETLKHA